MRKRKIPESEMVALRRIAAAQAIDDDSGIDFSDIPELTAEELASARPVKEVVSFRADPEVMEWLRGFGPGYSNRINSILRAVMTKNSAA